MFASVGWSYVIEDPLPPAAVYVTGQHTSLLEGYLSIAFSLCRSDLHPLILIAKEYFKGPFNPILHYLNCLPVNRQNPTGLISAIKIKAQQHPRFGIAFCPEGTRARTSGWRKGFYNTAKTLSLPIVFADWDPQSKKLKLCNSKIDNAKNFTFEEVMDISRDFYSTRTGIHPEKASPIRYYKKKK